MSADKSLRERVAEAIRADGTDLCDRPWDQLPPELKSGWMGDADRALEIIVEEAVRVVTERDPDKPDNWRYRREELPAALRSALSPRQP